MNGSNFKFFQHVSRRQFGFLVGAIGGWFGFLKKSEADPLKNGLEAWVDTLLPKDDFSPCASDLGVHLEIMKTVAESAAQIAMIEAGLKWANEKARIRGGVSFANLENAERAMIVAEAERLGNRTDPGLFFRQVHKMAMTSYYSKEESWKGLGLSHPPQPIGFPNYDKKPADEKR